MAFAAVLAVVLASCKTADAPAAPSLKPTLGARLTPTGGSAITGLVTFQPATGGATVGSTLWTGIGAQWRVVIHSTGICTSPNGFSAGPPWIPPGATEPPTIRIATTSDGIGNATVRIAGLPLDGPAGIAGKSVVVHVGLTSSLDAQPGVRNDRVACGVIETIKPLI